MELKLNTFRTTEQLDEANVKVSNLVSSVTHMVKNLPARQDTWLWSLGWEDPLEEGMATHSSLENSMDRGAGGQGGHKESDTTERLIL